MSERNGDRARFQKDRKRRLRLRQRTAQLRLALKSPAQMAATPQGTERTTPVPAVRRAG